MATVGFSNPYIAKLDVSAGTYSEGFKCGAAVSGTITPNYQSSSLYADNQLQESADAMTDASVSLTTSHLPAKSNTVIFGHDVDSQTGEVHYNKDDNANYVGMGFYEDEMVDGTVSYLAAFLPKVKFKETAKTYATKGNNITFATPTIEGSAGMNEDGDWKITKPFNTAAEAIAWIKGKLNIQ